MKIRDTFLLGSFTRYVAEGNLIHCNFNPTKTDEYGTKTGRLSSSDPNLQQVPTPGRDEFYGKLCRGIFVPIDDDHVWGKTDYSQIEYRMIAHFAMGPGSDEIRAKYNSDPKTDYHQYVMELTDLARSFAKNANFGFAFGMGIDKAMAYFGWTKEQAQEIKEVYHTQLPFIRYTLRRVSEVAIRRGYIRTILGRRSRLIDNNLAYTKFNALMQGSAADLMKKAMVDAYEAGIFDVLKLHLTVHDELDYSIPKTKVGKEATFELQYIMEHAVKLSVPILAEPEIGPNWADVEEITEDTFRGWK